MWLEGDRALMGGRLGAAGTPSRRGDGGGPPDEASLWRAVLEALDSNAKTARFVFIVLALAVAVAVVARVDV